MLHTTFVSFNRAPRSSGSRLSLSIWQHSALPSYQDFHSHSSWIIGLCRLSWHKDSIHRYRTNYKRKSMRLALMCLCCVWLWAGALDASSVKKTCQELTTWSTSYMFKLLWTSINSICTNSARSQCFSAANSVCRKSPQSSGLKAWKERSVKLSKTLPSSELRSTPENTGLTYQNVWYHSV